MSSERTRLINSAIANLRRALEGLNAMDPSTMTDEEKIAYVKQYREIHDLAEQAENMACCDKAEIEEEFREFLRRN